MSQIPDCRHEKTDGCPWCGCRAAEAKLAEIPPLRSALQSVVFALDDWHQWNDAENLWKAYWKARHLLYGTPIPGAQTPEVKRE